MRITTAFAAAVMTFDAREKSKGCFSRVKNEGDARSLCVEAWSVTGGEIVSCHVQDEGCRRVFLLR